MKKHPVSATCVWALTGALAVYAFFAVLLWGRHMLPTDWSGFLSLAGVMCVSAYALAGVVAVAMVVNVAAHAERLRQAGPEYRWPLVQAWTLVALSALVDFFAVQAGDRIMRSEVIDANAVPAFASVVITAYMLGARPILGGVLKAVERADKAEADRREAEEDARRRAEAADTRAETDRRIRHGNDARRRDLKVVTTGAAAALLGVGAGVTAPALPLMEPERVSTLEATADGSNEFDTGPARERSRTKGPKPQNQDLYDMAEAIVSETPNISVTRLMNILNAEIEEDGSGRTVYWSMARDWRKRIKDRLPDSKRAFAIETHGPNAELFDAA